MDDITLVIPAKNEAESLPDASITSEESERSKVED